MHFEEVPIGMFVAMRDRLLRVIGARKRVWR
jgi:hypothetical protein